MEGRYNLRKRPAPARIEVVPPKKQTKKQAKETISKETAPEEIVPKETTRKEKSIKEKATKEKATKEKVTKEKVTKEKATKEKVTKEKATEEKATEETTRKEKATKETTRKEKKVKLEKEKKIEIEEKPEVEEELETEKEIQVEKKKIEIVKDKEKDETKENVATCVVFGGDTAGELGQGKTGIIKINPQFVNIDGPIKQIACGAMHTICLTENGTVYSFGCNDELALGRLTDGDEKLESTPKIVSLDEKVVKVTAGDSHSAVLTETKRVYIWGNFRDEHGSVGLSPNCDGKPSLKPIQVSPKVEFKDIASGSNHMLLADTAGKVYSFGIGDQGQLGRLTGPQLAGTDGKPLAITAENRELFLTPQVVNLKEVDPQRPFICDAVFAGNYSSFATNTDKKKNRLAGWGLNNFHQLGFKGKKDQIVQHLPKRSTFTCSTSMLDVACGQHHTLFLTKSGRVFSAGRHDYGMLGLGQVDNPVCPAKPVEELREKTIISMSAGINTSFAVDDEGKVYSWGMNGPNLGLKKREDEDTKVPTEITSKNLENKKVLAVSSGSSHTALIIE